MFTKGAIQREKYRNLMRGVKSALSKWIGSFFILMNVRSFVIIKILIERGLNFWVKREF